MKRKSAPLAIWVVSLVCIVFAVTPAVEPAPQTASQLFQQAVHEEEAVGDPGAAIELYRRVLGNSEPSGNATPDLAARAELRLAALLDKIGRRTEAREHYLHIIAAYAGLPELLQIVDVARSALESFAAPNRGTVMVERRIWSGPNVDPIPAVTPDGRFIVGIDFENGDLAVREIATGEKRRLTDKGSWLDSQAMGWFAVSSPDGQQVAYAWLDGSTSDLRIVGLDGAGGRLLYSNPETFAWPQDWSPDGRHLLVTLGHQNGANELAMVSVADGSATVLKSFDWRSPLHAVFAPDGRYIVYDFPPSEDSVQRDIFLLAVDGTSEVTLVDHQSDDSYPVFTPDGRSILFFSDRTGSGAAWAVDVEDGRTMGAARLVKRNFDRVQPVGFAADGSFFYTLTTSMNDVFVAPFDAERLLLTGPAERAVERFVGANRSATFSPDGQRLAYLSRPRPDSFSPPRLTIRSLATRQDRELPLPELQYIFKPQWSPDGRSIYLRATRKSATGWGFYRVELETGKVEAAVEPESDSILSLASLSPDGTQVLYRRAVEGQNNRFDLVLHDLRSAEEEVLLASSEQMDHMTFAPDGRWIAFTRLDSERRRFSLELMTVEGREVRELMRTDRDDEAFTGLGWTPDGEHILFGRLTTPISLTARSELWRIAVIGGEPTRMGLEMEGRIRALGFHPDGTQLVFTSGHASSELWMIEDFVSEITDR